MEIWNKGTRPRAQHGVLLFLLLLACPSSLRLLSPPLESRLLPWQHRYKTPKRRDHRRPPEKRRDGRKRERLVRSLAHSSFHLALRVLLPSSALSRQSPPHLPPLGLIRCLKKSIRLSLPTRSSVFSFYGARVWSSLFLSFSLVTTVRHFVCVTCREKPLQ